MTKVSILFIFAMLIFCACSRTSDQRRELLPGRNQLLVTDKGDTLENGFWEYDAGPNEVSSSGNFTEGFKVDSWIYRTTMDTAKIIWRIVEKDGVKINVPSSLTSVTHEEKPTIFQARINGGDDDTYVVLLRYNLADLNSSVYDYLYQYNRSLNDHLSGRLISTEFKKFTFKKREVFRSIVTTEKEKKYKAISYFFVVDKYLYDFTYKNYADTEDLIAIELFNDMFYSLECNHEDLFAYNDRRYMKEEEVVFKDSSSF